MKKYIEKVSEKIFEDVPYSKSSESVREKVTSAMQEKFDEKISSGESELKALGDVMSSFGSKKDASLMAKLEENAIDGLSSADSMDKKAFGKMFLKARICLFIAALFAAYIGLNVLQGLIFMAPAYILSVIVTVLITLGMLRLCKKRYLAMDYEKVSLMPDAKKKLDILLDRFKKRTLNSFLLMLGLTANFISLTFERFIRADMNTDELIVLVMNDQFLLYLGLFFCFKNIFYLAFLSNAVNADEKKLTRRYIGRAGMLCLAFMVGSLTLLILFTHLSEALFTFYYLATALFIGIFAIVNFKKRERIVRKNICINKPRIAVFTVFAILAASVSSMQKANYVLQPYIMSISGVEHKEHEISYDEKTGVYTITADDEDFKILHLTDIHIGGSTFSSYKDYKALNACYKIIEHTKPDLVVITGDLVFPMGIMSLSLNNQAPITQFSSFMRNIGIPWAFTFGNHDTEKMATGSREEICAQYKSLSYKSTGNLLYPYIQPDITGRSNQMIEVANPDGSIRQALFLIDSNDYTGNGINDYDYIHDDQVEWYTEQVNALTEKQGEVVPSLIFFHIPLQEYRTAFELYEDGSDEVEYYFGEIGETMINPICCSDHSSKLFDRAVELGSTKGMFCGHDHYNNISLNYKGIRLTYGMSIDYLAMPGIAKDTKQRGAELITVHPDSCFDVEQIKLTDIE